MVIVFGVGSGVDISEVIVKSGIGSHTPCFSLDLASGFVNERLLPLFQITDI
jgi:hypothetical protein